MDKHNLTGLYLSNQLLRDEKDEKRAAAIRAVIELGHAIARKTDAVARQHEYLRTTPATLLDVALDNCLRPVDFDALDAALTDARSLVKQYGPDTQFEMGADGHSLVSLVEQAEAVAQIVAPLRAKCGGSKR